MAPIPYSMKICSLREAVVRRKRLGDPRGCGNAFHAKNVYNVIDMMLSIIIHRRSAMKPSAKLLTVREVADRLGLKESTIRKRILQRQIAYVKPSLRAVRIPIEELERIMAAGFRPAVIHPTTT